MALIGFGLRTALGVGLARRSSWDVMHGGDLAVWPLVWLAGLRNPGRCTVLSAHGTDIALAHRRGLAAFLYRRYLRLATRLLPSVAVLANSRATAGLCTSIGFSTVTVVPLATRMGAEIHAEMEPYIFFFGRLIRQKGCSWFIREVLPLLPDDLRLVVAGTVWDPQEGQALSHPRVEFVGPVDPAGRDRLCAAATAVIVPNVDTGIESFEGYGLAATEAAAASGIVLAADIDGLRDAVRHGLTGFLLPPGDSGCWAARIEEVRGWPPERRRAFITRSRAAVRQEYSWSEVARRTMRVYRGKSGNRGEL